MRKRRNNMSKNRSWFGWALAFVALVSGTSPVFAVDCNTNGVENTVDISVGTSTDCNSNGVPDECDPNGVRDGVPVYVFVDADAVGNNTGTHFLHAYTDA